MIDSDNSRLGSKVWLLEGAEKEQPKVVSAAEQILDVFHSFNDSQGEQPYQWSWQQAIVRRRIENGQAFDLSVFVPAKDQELSESEKELMAKELPSWHLDILDRIHTTAEFRFHKGLYTDSVWAVTYNDNSYIRNRQRLEELGISVGGTSEMSSFTPEEYDGIIEEITPYTDFDPRDMTSCDITEKFVLPRAIYSETRWQTEPGGRPRKSGDIRKSVWMSMTQIAFNKQAKGMELSVRDEIYIDMAYILQDILKNEPESQIAKDYYDLVAIYNHNHPDSPVESLHLV